MRDFFGVDDAYLRPVPHKFWRSDVPVALILATLAVLGAVAMSGQAPEGYEVSPGWTVLAVGVAAILLAFRRRFPILVLLLLTGVHFVVMGETMWLIAAQAGMQVAYFLGLYSALAWARNREALMLATLAVLLAMTAWIVTSYARNVHLLGGGSSVALMVAFELALNIAYFGGATWLGRSAWLKARDEAELSASRAVIEEQAKQLAEKATIDERLRISRELHDSVAHHVALIGIQAGAARRALEKKPEQAAAALHSLEHASRQTVKELQHIVGSLREADGSNGTHPDLNSLPALFADFDAMGLSVDYTMVGTDDAVSATQAATLYRVIQEALGNVRRHSTARNARVTVRIQADAVEAEILDNGRQLHGTSGTGVGLMGIRERIHALNGTTQIGPRSERGYRVLVRIPLSSEESP